MQSAKAGLPRVKLKLQNKKARDSLNPRHFIHITPQGPALGRGDGARQRMKVPYQSPSIGCAQPAGKV